MHVPVHPRHKPQLDREITRFNRFGLMVTSLIILLSGAITAVMMGAFLLGGVTAEVILFTLFAVGAMGVTYLIFPFATPTTVDIIGMKWSRRITRGLGGVLVLIPIVVLLHDDVSILVITLT